MRNSSGPRAAVALGLGAALLWGVSGAVAADAFAEITPADAAQVRAVVAALVLVPFAWHRNSLRSSVPSGLLIAFGLSLAGVHVTYYMSVDRLGVGPGITLQFLAPVLVLVWMRVVQRRAVGPFVWGAAALAVVGTALIARVWDVKEVDAVGLIAGLASAVFFATYLMLGEHLGKTMRPSGVMAWGFVIASVFWLVVHPIWSFPFDASARVWAEMLWLGILGTAVPFIMELAALQRASSGAVGVIASAEPVIGALTAWLWLSQGMEPGQILGMACTVLAVAAVQRWGVAEIEVPLDAGR